MIEDKLTDLYAIGPLAEHREVIRRAVLRVLETRAGEEPLAGDWRGHVGPRVDGRLNVVAGPPPASRRVRAGANGDITPARDRTKVIPL